MFNWRNRVFIIGLGFFLFATVVYGRPADPSRLPDNRPLLPPAFDTAPNYSGNIQSSVELAPDSGKLSDEELNRESPPAPGSQGGGGILSVCWLIAVLLGAAGLVSYFYAKGKKEAGQG